MKNNKKYVLIIASIMIISGFAMLILPDNVNVSNNSVTNPFTTSQIDNMQQFIVNYKSINISTANIYLDTFSPSSSQRNGGFIIYAQSFAGIYYINDSSSVLKLGTFNFITGKTSLITNFPSLTYTYLDYAGENYVIMPYYNQTNVLNWIISYGDNSTTGYMNYWAYNILNGTTVDMNLSYAVSSSSNYQINYLGKGIMMATNSTGDYNLYNIYTHSKIGSGSIDYMETNNFYFVPIYHLLVDVAADGSTSDSVAFYNFNYTTSSFSLISNIQYSTSALAVNGVPDIMVNTTNKEIYVNPQASTKFNVIFQYVNSTTVNLVYSYDLATTSVTIDGTTFSPAYYQTGNGYIPLVSNNPYYAGDLSNGLDLGMALNPFSNLSANNTIYFPIKSYISATSSADIFNGYPTLSLSLANINDEYNYASYYNLTGNYILYLYNSSMPENYSTLLQPTVNHYNLEIKESGLSSGTSWSYTFNGTSYSLTNNSYNYSLINGNYALSVSSVNGYTVTYPSTITIDNASKIAYVNFTAIPKYSVTIQENGLPSDTQWNFTIKYDGSTVVAETLATSSYTTLLQNDTYDLYAGTVSGYNLHIHTSPFTVSGSAITEYVNYTAIPTYTLFLKETGLASGTTWIAYVGSTQYSSSNAYINVTGLTNGTYSLSIDNVADYSLGSYPTSFTISGSNYYINVTFTHNTTLHSVKIIAEHIANVNSITWSVVFNGTTYSSQNSNTIIIPSLKNGTYSFSVNAISGYVIDKYPSSLTIDGANITQYIYFNETFSISIVVSGYLGQYTYVFNGTAHSISGNTVINGLVNYTYSFSVNAISGYTITYNSPIIISGKDVTENVTFTAVVTKTGEYIVEFIITGLAPHTTWSVTVNGQEYISNTYELNITLVNGTYFPDITTPNNYVLNDQPALVVAGSNTVYYISASPTTFGSFIQYMPYFLVFVFIIGMLALVIAVRRR